MKKMVNYETVSYLIVGVLTTFVYFLIRFTSLGIVDNPLFAVFCAQIGAIVFAFITNKRFVFKDGVSGFRSIIKQFMTFVVGRVFVFMLDVLITFIAVEKMSEFFINFFHLNYLPYESSLFSNSLMNHIIGTPELLNQFIFAIAIQILAIVLNYFLSKKTVFKEAELTS